MKDIRTFTQASRKALLLPLAICAVFLSHEARGQTLFWNTNGTSATWTSNNWGTSGSGPFTSGWTNGDNADFTANSSVTFATATVGNITVGASDTVTWTVGGTFTTSGVTAVNVGAGGSLNWSGTQTMSTSDGFSMTGPGTWVIGAQTSAYTGGFTLNSGTVSLTGSSGVDSLGAGSLTINGGTIQSTGSKTYAPTSIAIGSGTTVTFTGTGTSTWGASTVSLGGSTPVTMILGVNSATDTGSETFSGVVSGAAGATLNIQGVGSGAIAFSNTANTFSGVVNVTGAEFDIAADGSLGTAPSTPTNSITVNGGRFGTVSGSSFTLNSNRTIALGSTTGTSIGVTGSAGVMIYNGVMQDLTTGGILVKQGAGTLELGGQSTYTGNTSINNGTVELLTGGNLPSGTTVSLGQSNTNLGTFNLNGINQQIAGLNSTIGTNATGSKNTVTSATPATLTIGGTMSYSYGAGTAANSGVITGLVSLVMQGAGTQQLGDVNTYTGTTTVSGGTLVVDGSISGSATTVQTGGTLGGSGTVGSLSLQSGGTLAPGLESAGESIKTLTATGLTWNGGGTMDFDLSASSNASDLLALGSGALTEGTGGTFQFNFLGGGEAGQTYDLINFTSTTFASPAAFSATNLGSGLSANFELSGSQLEVQIQAVPEPSAWGALVWGVGILIGFRRFRQQNHRRV
jgi:fibronectin-binding autotransporter adhesin